MKVLVCDGCRKPSQGEGDELVLTFRDTGLEYCKACRVHAAAFLEAANAEMPRIERLWADELVRLRALHAPTLKTLPVPRGIPEDD